jgi:uncharacterized paraquat-inducible protein A
MLGIIGLLIVVVPSFLRLGSRFLEFAGIPVEIIAIAISISRFAEIGLFVLFTILLTLEFVQDRMLDQQYQKERHKKLKNSNGSYECQYCGCRKIRSYDKRCPVCGRDLA